MSKDAVRIIPLGGLGEIGKNMTVVEYGGKIVVVDCGLAFPRDEMPGIDLVLPDVSYLIERKDDVLGFLITHGHEDHFGALPYILRQVNAPVYASRLTLAFAKSKLDEHGMLRLVEINEVDEHTQLEVGPFRVSFVAVSHSVPDALSVIIETPLGAVVATGDYKFDHTPIDGRVTDVNRFAQLGERGVLALLADSTNADVPGSTASESTVGQSFHQIFAEARGRVILACFASHIHRVQQAIQIAHLHGRRFAISGRSMVKNVNIARTLGYLNVPEGAMIKLHDIDDYKPEELLILSTGSQGEPLSALSRMAFDDHPQVAMQPGDTVVISARPIPGNEVSVMNTVNRLLKSGAEVIYGEETGVHVSGHAAQEDQRMMLNLLKPRYFLPVHGEYRHQHVHAELARQSGLDDEHVLILENGDVLEIDADGRARGRQGARRHGLRRRFRDRRRRTCGIARPPAARRGRHPHRGRHHQHPDRRLFRTAGARGARLPLQRRPSAAGPRAGGQGARGEARRARRRARDRTAPAQGGRARHAPRLHLQEDAAPAAHHARDRRGVGSGTAARDSAAPVE